MEGDPRILCFAGSARAASYNKQLARAAARSAAKLGVTATFADLADYTMPLYDGDVESLEGPPDNARRLLDLVASHDCVFIASPEYNASIAPLLKNSLDWMSRVREPAAGLDIVKSRLFALGAASPGGTGGMRGLIALRYTLEMGFGAIVLPDQVLVPRAGQAFAADGSLLDADAGGRLDAAIARLITVARRLRVGAA